MIRLLDNFDLSKNNTFNLKAKAKRFFEFTESEELLTFLERENLPEKYLILGGGSNLLFKGDFNGLVIHPNIPGILETDEDRNYAYVEVGAGVDWDYFVKFSVYYHLGGLENLSLIPGNVGSAPVQNIGAYGVEVKDHVHLVKGIHLETGQRVQYTNEACLFGYRDSIFKRDLKGKVVITSVVFKLDKFAEFNLEYGALSAEVQKLGETNLQTVRQAVINIRKSKLPDPELIGNAGSFFKNPVVAQADADKLKIDFPDMPCYSALNGDVKLAAGWLIDQCGWKGYKNGAVGVHKDQALVLVNYGGAKGEDLVALSSEIQESVKAKFGVQLFPEVNFVD